MNDAPPTTATEMLAEARAHLDRLSPQQAREAIRSDALLVDIRSDQQREHDGVIPDARFIPRNVFEWRCDPTSDWRDPEITRDTTRQVIVFCEHGHQSSLAARTLQRLGYPAATDVIGGFEAWREAGLEFERGR